ncbi:uncharacterized protein [Temnothorax longispinosus]|uniref:uncharacterized protein n=1 Tax=Temnothorax longispinosus TaxID=300112 RepID=UPI003A999D83
MGADGGGVSFSLVICDLCLARWEGIFDKVEFFTEDDDDSGRPSSSEGKSTNKTVVKQLASDSLAGTSVSGHTDKQPRFDDAATHVLDKVPRIEEVATVQGKFSFNDRFQCLATSLDMHDMHEELCDTSANVRRAHEKISPSGETSVDVRRDRASDAPRSPLASVNCRERRPPPIYLNQRPQDFQTLSTSLKKDIGDNFHLKFIGNQVKLQFNKLEDFTDFKKFAIAKNLPFHTYSLPEEKSITVTLKGLPNIPNLSIKEELKDAGIIINLCTYINAEESLYAIFKINLSAKYTLSHLRRIRFLFNSRIYWDKFINSKKILRCFQCQAFGHTSTKLSSHLAVSSVLRII